MEDYIGRKDFIDKMINIIGLSSKDRTWTFAIDGAWGSGKTFLLDMLEKELDENEDNIVIKYDTWKNDFYSEPLVALIYNILSSSKLMRTTDSIKQGIMHSLSIVSSLLNFVPGVKEFKENVKGFVGTVKGKGQKEETYADDYVSYEKALQLLNEELTKATKEKRLIFLVDELDRCEPDYALEVLNRLHNLFHIPNCVVIVAVNKSRLEEVIDKKYGETDNEYLEKFFDLTLSLSNSGDIDTRQKYAEKFLLEFLTMEELSKAQLFFKIISTYLENKARSIVKFFEILRFIVNNFESKTEKYDYACLGSFVILQDFHCCEGYNDISDKIDFTDKYTNNLEANFKGDLLQYISSSITTRFANLGHKSYSDPQINRFIAMLTIVRFQNDRDALQCANSWYQVKFDEKILKQIKNIVDMANLLYYRKEDV